MADIVTLYPQDPSFSGISFKTNTPTLTTETFSGKSRRTGYGTSFYSWQVKYPTLTAVITTGATTNGSVSKGVKTVTLAGCGNAKTLIGGDYIKFANHSKVYQVVGTATSNSAGAMQLYFSGSLVADVPSGTVIEFDDVKFTAIVDADVQQYDIGVGGFTSLSVSMRETW